MEKIDNTFLTYASNVLAETNSGLSGTQIVELLSAYAVDYSRVIPHSSYPFDSPNKRSALRDNLNAFEKKEQVIIINRLCDLLEDNQDVKKLKTILSAKYGDLISESTIENELIEKSKHWLSKHPSSFKQYESALSKYNSDVFSRNVLDDMRLSLELLLKDLLNNNKSMENQISELGKFLKEKEISIELRNMLTKTIDYYTDFQNNHVKHEDRINKDEIEYIIELTSIIMKLLIKLEEANKN